MSVSVVNVTENKKYHEMLIKSEAWKQVGKRSFRFIQTY